MEEPRKGDQDNPCMYVYKAKIQSEKSFDKLKLKFLVRGDMKNKEMIVDTWYPTESTRNLKYFLADASKQKQG